MRPVIGDGQARARTFKIGFDAQNARIIRLVATEVELMRVRRFRDLSPQTKKDTSFGICETKSTTSE